MPEKLFKSDLEIPDLIPAELILPRTETLYELNPVNRVGNVSPVEMFYLLTNGNLAAAPRYSIANDFWLIENNSDRLTNLDQISKMHSRMLYGEYSYHLVELIFRVAFDPRRTDLIDLGQAYRMTPNKTSTLPIELEIAEDFASRLGVVERG
jgi:hypothetical protein